MEIIKLTGVNFGYGRNHVLIDIDMAVEEGDFLAVIGPNGSGKTTLIKLMAGLLEPRTGRIDLFGRPRSEFKGWSLIGYVPQNSTRIDPLFPASAEEVVAMAFGAGKREMKARGLKMGNSVDQALRAVGMEAMRRIPVSRLSGGQQQRIFIARALVTEPRVLILDEPTTGIDAEAQANFYDMLHSLNEQRGLTIVLVTHEIGVVNRHVNRVACLNQRLIYHGRHEDFCSSDVFRDIISRGDHIIGHRH